MAVKKDCLFYKNTVVDDCKALNGLYCKDGPCNFYKSDSEYKFDNVNGKVVKIKK